MAAYEVFRQALQVVYEREVQSFLHSHESPQLMIIHAAEKEYNTQFKSIWEYLGHDLFSCSLTGKGTTDRMRSLKRLSLSDFLTAAWQEYSQVISQEKA